MLTFTVIFMSPNPFGWQALTMQGSSDSSIDILPLAKGVTCIVVSPSTNSEKKMNRNEIQIWFYCCRLRNYHGREWTFQPIPKRSSQSLDDGFGHLIPWEIVVCSFHHLNFDLGKQLVHFQQVLEWGES